MAHRPLQRSDDILDFAALLIEEGGLVAVVGSSLRVRALLHGARSR